MPFSPEDFIENLKGGFFDRNVLSSKAFHPALLVNSRQLETRVLTSIQAQLLQCDSFWFSVAFATTGGVASLISTLEEVGGRGVRGRVLVSQYQNFTQPEALRRLLKLLNVDLRISVDHNFHAKGYLFESREHYALIVGSSNLTADALSKNAEWNLKVSAHKNSALMVQTLKEFQYEFDRGVPVTEDLIAAYENVYQRAQPPWGAPLSIRDAESPEPAVHPNKMQNEALANLTRLRASGSDRALLVSATGTGKTYLSAFDAKAMGARRLLFVVHRRNIAQTALESFRRVFGRSKTYGMYSGQTQDVECDYLFCTIQTLSKPEHHYRFTRDHFDYIVIDESHRAGAQGYQVVMNYFEPRFLLGMTATPERTDGFDVFSLFNHTIAYEIRLHQALEEEMLCPFHYYGVTDLTINDETIEENADFNKLTSNERVNRILEKSKFYGTDSGELRGLVFCSRTNECEALASEFRSKGLSAIALSGASSEDERAAAIRRLESNNPVEKLDYIFTVDIFNEGVDIPCVNQVIMLRPTQSAIVFVQQMGRGLRKSDGKSYLTIIDFIGNYTNNYLVPVALYGDHSYNKDRLRKLISSGSGTIPGTSTINFDRITKDRIYQAIDTANMRQLRVLRDDYKLLKYKIGRPPMMLDFLQHGARDPFLYVEYKKSFFNFAESLEDELNGTLSEDERLMLESLSREVNNAKRIEESLMLKWLLERGDVDLDHFVEEVKRQFGYEDKTAIQSAIHGLNLNFVRARQNGLMVPLGQKLEAQVVECGGNLLRFSAQFREWLDNPVFKRYLSDCTDWAVERFRQQFVPNKFRDGFQLYQKYSRKDVFRILKWETNPIAQNVGGYILSDDGSNCPIFVTYHKSDDIAEATKYEDYFVNNSVFAWMSKSNRTLESPDVKAIKNAVVSHMRVPLFIKKTDDEGTEFYYVSDVEPDVESFEQVTIRNDNDVELPVVKLEFRLKDPVEESIYRYLSEA